MLHWFADTVLRPGHTLTIATADAVLAIGSPFAIGLLWITRSLVRPIRIFVSVLTTTAAIGALFVSSGQPPVQQANLIVVALAAGFCLIRDIRSKAAAERRPVQDQIHLGQPPEWSSSGDADTRVMEDGMMLNLQDLAPEIDAVPPEEFTQRAQRVGVFSPEQITSLEKLVLGQRDLSKALTEAVTDQTLTVYQALHLLWGKEDRLRVGPYAVMNVLGVGGMSVVYRAQKLTGGAEIALKVVPRTAKHESRFRREMQLAQLMAHPNIVVAYDVGQTVDRNFIAMELVNGRNLQDVVRLHGNLSEAVALQYVLQAARGLEHAHERGVIHRDVKPGNLLLCRDGTIKLADLGLSRETGGLESDSADAISGTIDFMAPEQATPVSKSIPQIDVYGLGTTLFYLLTGKILVTGETTQEKLLNLTVSRRFNRLPSGSATARTMNLLRKLTAWEPGERFATMADVISEIETILEMMGRDYAPRTVRVLVVEDDPAQMFLTVRLVSRTNRSIAVTKTDRLQMAIETYGTAAASDEPIDLVLLDLNLPDSEGLETIRQFRQAHPEAAIIVLSNTQSGIAPDCRMSGAIEYVCKSDLNMSKLERLLFATLSELRGRMIQA